MKTHQKIITFLRKNTPLLIRQKIGPIIALIYYYYVKYSDVKKPKVMPINATLDYIINEKVSVIRFGDGEITLIANLDLSFQEKNNLLAQKLIEVIKSTDEKLLICIPGIWGDLSAYLPYARSFIIHHLFKHGYIWNDLLSFKRTYGDAYITRNYLSLRDKSQSEITFKKFISIWQNKNVVLIEGEKSRVGVGNTIFSNVKSVKRILCPAENAFSKYEQIKEEATKVPKDSLILLALGPTAKILAYDLFLLGYRVIDIGHLDMEYDMFIRKENKQVRVSYKYFNEINERDPEPCTDSNYTSQIIAKII